MDTKFSHLVNTNCQALTCIFKHFGNQEEYLLLHLDTKFT